MSRAAGMRIFYTRHLSLPKRLMGASQFRQLMSWQRVDDPDKIQPWFLRDSPAFQIVNELEPLANEAVFDKLTMSAFEGTPLAMALRAVCSGLSLSESVPRLGSISPVATVQISDLCRYSFATHAELDTRMPPNAHCRYWSFSVIPSFQTWRR